MNIKILEEKEVPQLKRKNIIAKVESQDKTPSHKELKKELSVLLKTKEELIVIKKIGQIFGNRVSKIEVYIYKDEKSFKEIEKPVEKKEEKSKEGTAPSEQKPVEKKE